MKKLAPILAGLLLALLALAPPAHAGGINKYLAGRLTVASGETYTNAVLTLEKIPDMECAELAAVTIYTPNTATGHIWATTVAGLVIPTNRTTGGRDVGTNVLDTATTNSLALTNTLVYTNVTDYTGEQPSSTNRTIVYTNAGVFTNTLVYTNYLDVVTNPAVTVTNTLVYTNDFVLFDTHVWSNAIWGLTYPQRLLRNPWNISAATASNLVGRSLTFTNAYARELLIELMLDEAWTNSQTWYYEMYLR